MRIPLILVCAMAMLVVSPALAESAPIKTPAIVEGAPSENIWLLDSKRIAHHLQTGLLCPDELGMFHLVKLNVYDRMGFDVSCHYMTTDGEAVTMYLTKRELGESLQDDMAQAQEELMAVHSNAVPTPARHSLRLTNRVVWLTAVYALGDMESDIWVADYAGWTLKFRASYLPQHTAVAFAVMQVLADASPDVRDHLQACAAAKVANPKGRPVADRPLSLATQALALTQHQEQGQSSPNPRWCAMAAMELDGIPILIWRNIAKRSISDFVMKATFDTKGRSPALFLVLNNQTSDYLNRELKYPTPAKRAHVVLGNLGYPGAYAAFDDEPDMQAFALVAAHAVQLNSPPDIYINEKGNIVVEGTDIAPLLNKMRQQ